jgi:nicotinate-nucleotide adenylyltransferase
MKTGLFFGSFNPIHIGHLIIADHIAQYTDLREVWLVVSPHNPLKDKSTLARDHDRLHLVQLAVDDNPRLKASSVEFQLPKPSYTIDTLTYLKEKYPEKEFALIMGSDNFRSIHLWKNYELLLEHFDIYLYNRPEEEADNLKQYKRVHVVPAPLLGISSTYVRERIRSGKSVRYLVPEKVFDYLEVSDMYKK